MDEFSRQLAGLQLFLNQRNFLLIMTMYGMETRASHCCSYQNDQVNNCLITYARNADARSDKWSQLITWWNPHQISDIRIL